MFKHIYHSKRVLVTGHTGFKGSWLSLWLATIGAQVTGYALPPPTEPNHYDLLNLDLNSFIGDIRDAQKLIHVFKQQQPEIVFHLAAQPIVRLSFKEPVETFSSNVMGTVNVLEAARQCDTVRAIVIITSDKCYENREWPWGYREIDSLGGYDPYSASKGCAEIATSCWRNSFFNLEDYGSSHHTLVSSCRAGNVIGGGDWAVDRLVPDIIRVVSQGGIAKIRNPHATRAWQHVLEPLSGYLLLGQTLLEGRREFAEAWNFGPSADEDATVEQVVIQAKQIWPEILYEIDPPGAPPHEANMLRLDSSKAKTRLRWAPVWDAATAVEKTALWYKAFLERKQVESRADLLGYIADARHKSMAWAEE